MNIKGRSRIRNSRIYSDQGQTVWSCHPQFGEDFKNYYLRKTIFFFKNYNLQKKNSPGKYFLQVGNNALKLKHVWSFTNWIPILNSESKWAPTTLPASDRHCGMGLQIERMPMRLISFTFWKFPLRYVSMFCSLLKNWFTTLYLWMKIITDIMKQLNAFDKSEYLKLN